MLPKQGLTRCIPHYRAGSRYRIGQLIRSTSGRAPRRDNQRLSFWPFAAIFCLGVGSFYFLVQARLGETPKPERDKLLPRE